MRSDKIMPGIILVAIGAIFLLNNYNVINFHWGNLIRLWPIFLIMGGVNLVFANNRSAWATILKIAVVAGGFGLLIFAHFDNHWFSPFNRHWNLNDRGWHKDDGNDSDDDDADNTTTSKGVVKIEGSSTFTEPYVAAANAKLIISGGGTVYKLSDTTNNLFSATTKESYNRYEYKHTMEGNVPVMTLQMKKNKGNFEWDSDKNNSADIKLNTNPIWDINVNAGATELDFDLSKFKINNFVINGGAASFHVKLGQPLANTDVDVSTGVSEVEIKVPENAACRIVASTGLSSNDFKGFEKKDNNSYETPGYGSATNKITIQVKGGLSDVKVIRY